MGYFILFFFMVMLTEGVGGSQLFENKRKFKYAYIVLFIIMWVFFGLREYSILGDACMYVLSFQGDEYITWHSIGWYFDEYREPLFAILSTLIRSFTSDYTIYFYITSLFFCLGITIIFKEESEDYLLSMILLTTLGILTFCMAGLRQAIAMGICYMAYPTIKKRKPVLFLILVLLAYLFHRTAMFFVFAYPLYNVKVRPAMFIFVAISLVVGITRNSIIKTVAEFLTSDDEYLNYFNKEDTGLNYTMFIIQVAMLIFCFLYKDEICEKNKSGNFLFMMSILGLCVQALSATISEFFRLSMYFSVFLSVLVTKAILAEKNNSVRWTEFFLIIIVCAYYMVVLSSVISVYLPFWRHGS